MVMQRRVMLLCAMIWGILSGAESTCAPGDASNTMTISLSDLDDPAKIKELEEFFQKYQNEKDLAITTHINRVDDFEPTTTSYQATTSQEIRTEPTPSAVAINSNTETPTSSTAMPAGTANTISTATPSPVVTTTKRPAIVNGGGSGSSHNNLLGRCPWIRYVSTASMDFMQANRICEDNGEVIARIPDGATYNGLVRNMRSLWNDSANVWVGMNVTWNLRVRSQDWFLNVNTTNTSIEHTRPHLKISRSNRWQGMKNSYPNSTADGVICKKPFSNPSGQCNLTVAIDFHHYCVVKEADINYTEASNICEEMGAKVARIPDETSYSITVKAIRSITPSDSKTTLWIQVDSDWYPDDSFARWLWVLGRSPIKISIYRSPNKQTYSLGLGGWQNSDDNEKFDGVLCVRNCHGDVDKETSCNPWSSFGSASASDSSATHIRQFNHSQRTAHEGCCYCRGDNFFNVSIAFTGVGSITYEQAIQKATELCGSNHNIEIGDLTGIRLAGLDKACIVNDSQKDNQEIWTTASILRHKTTIDEEKRFYKWYDGFETNKTNHTNVLLEVQGSNKRMIQTFLAEPTDRKFVVLCHSDTNSWNCNGSFATKPISGATDYFLLIASNKMTYDEANASCFSCYGEIASIPDEATFDKIVEELRFFADEPFRREIWFDANVKWEQQNQPCTGAYYKWISQNASNTPGPISISFSGNASDGMKSQDASTALDGVVCWKPYNSCALFNATNNTESIKICEGGCGCYWIKVNDGNKLMNLTEANSTCRRHNSSLAQINDSIAKTAIQQYLAKNLSRAAIWIGSTNNITILNDTEECTNNDASTVPANLYIDVDKPICKFAVVKAGPEFKTNGVMCWKSCVGSETPSATASEYAG